MLTTKAIFARKENWFEPQDCMIEKIVELSAADYKAFSQNMLRDHDVIADNIDSMFVDGNGIWHGMLVLGDGSNNAILVESEGSNYARYAAFLPSFKPYVESQILQLADLIIKDGTQKTTDGCWAIGFDEISPCRRNSARAFFFALFPFSVGHFFHGICREPFCAECRNSDR